MDKVKLSVLGLSYSQTQSGAYALVLAEEGGDRRIPIIIGGVEAQSIAIQLEGLKPPRPLTHDLFVSFAEAFQIRIEEVYIYKLEEGIFYAELVCLDGKNRVLIDSRTSDAVALALRFNCPIYTSREILDKAGIYLEDVKPHDTETPPPEKKEKKPEQKVKEKEKDPLGISTRSLEELDVLLKKAIEDEDYETASLIRDEIKKRK